MNPYIFAFKFGNKKLKAIMPIIMAIALAIETLRWIANQLEKIGLKLTSWSGRIDYRTLKKSNK